ncbi:TLR4-like protein [Mya arenaria]|uniref:TLR4-like protein n=1 Tax=Mya arenaria TaxID=6604 RepID=A0ABY7E5B3_MYAAR|nr:TLR4-like protein [Mya arenaria]
MSKKNDLSYNNIEVFDVDVKTLNNLLHLNFRGNAVHKLNHLVRQLLEDNSERIGKNFTLDLRNNSIEYSCTNQRFLYWLLDHKERLHGFHEMVFYSLFNYIWSHFVQKEMETSVLVLHDKAKLLGYRRLVNDFKAENYRYDARKYTKTGGHTGMKLCVHQRDFLPGIPIQDNIVDAIRTSKKTVVILSKNFVMKQWGIFEFNMARMESIDKRVSENGCLVIVLYENVPAKIMPLEILDWIEHHSYISYTSDPDGQPLFWENMTTAIKR